MSFWRILGALFGTARGKGYIGELKVSLMSGVALPRSAYKPFRDVALRVPDGTTQVDHIYVSRFGIFVVETKNMGGWIFGREHDRQWTQVLGGHKTRFQNPLRQNYRHVKAVEAVLVDMHLPPGAVHSVVAFVGTARLKTRMPDNVTVGTGFVSYVRSFRETMLTDGQVLAVCSKIETERLASSAAKHTRHMRQLNEWKRSSSRRKCPRCGRGMVLRTTRRGPNVGRRFWGCSGFPECRYIFR